MSPGSGKTCSRCHQQKPLSDFKSDSRKPDGKASSCKACNTAVGYVSTGLAADLCLYDQACRALAEARRIDEVMSVRDESERLRLYARQAKDRDLMADAVEIRLRAERRLGFLLKEAKQVGQIAEGRPAKNCAEPEQFPRVTLDEAGIDRKLSSMAQKRASISEQAFDAMLRATRDRVMSDRAKIVEASALPSGARAIMGSRQEPADSLDYFPTPPWATRALLEHVFPVFGFGATWRYPSTLEAWEPACGEGHMAEVLREYFQRVYASDIEDYGYGDADVDFITTSVDGFDWIVSNPPFGELTEQFVLHAIECADVGVAMFVRLQWLESVGRYERVFRDNPPTLIAFFAERVPLCKGRWDPDGDTATAYIWLVWVKGEQPRAPFWIPPGCRERLTKPDDAVCFTQSPVARRGNQAQPQQEEVA